jgi:hypothetical protein
MLQTIFSHLVSVFFFFFICGAEAVVETREEVMIEVSSRGKRDVKKPTLKRAAKSPENVPKLKRMKKVKVNASDDAIYKQYCCTNYHIKDPPEGEPL